MTLSCDKVDDDIEFGNKSHGNVTSNPVAVCTSESGPENTKSNKVEIIFYVVERLSVLLDFSSFLSLTNSRA